MAEYIDKQEAIETVAFYLEDPDGVDHALQSIKNISSADVQPVKHGRWIWDDEGFHCSECFFHAYDNSLEIMQGIWNHCPHCGARMGGET